ncbi:PspA/IM30 family protein [Maritalea porphyrae]|uniref:PspA/IM30 family protein n=1 Tax=Maritalea porphyrae TaxID=880732 RepID=A0ABQ5UPF6_9HYPH|nr:PspA/IM30 family protein [Maritalea porphyrae]GLQ17171.1 hypothetical protein GCM10007879_14200 [Maritalea porphyrae]
MAEGIAKRVGRIISGSVNALVDAVEDATPQLLMEQAIREVDEAIDEVRAELGRVVAGNHLANKHLADKNAKHADLSDKIELAISQNREDLAEAAISGQLDIEAQIPVLEQTIRDSSEQQKELEGYIAALQAKKREMEDVLKAQKVARKSQATINLDNNASGSQINVASNVARKVDDAGSAFDRIIEKQTGVSLATGQVNADAAKIAELEKLSRDSLIKKRLDDLKNRSAGDA